ncbi:MAG: alpha/beta hydrolase [Bacteroidales bacterium]
MKQRKNSKIIRRSLLTVVVVFCLLMLTPRILSILFPGWMPVGYGFILADKLALITGLEKMVNLTPPVPSDVEEIKEIEYRKINGKSLAIDLYRPRDTTLVPPLLVFIHGGSWTSGKRSDYLVYLVHFASRGYVTATISYRFLQDSLYPACIEDVNAALDWLYENAGKYRYDQSRIAVIGGSAGGHLAMLAAYGWTGKDSDSTRAKVKAVVDFYGPADLTTTYARNHVLVRNLIGRKYEDATDLYHDASPLFHTTVNSPPTLIFHGTSDELVPLSQSKALKTRLDSLGVYSEFYSMPLWPHTMDIARRVNDFAKNKMEVFLGKYLK